jgi:hypothetical protein
MAGVRRKGRSFLAADEDSLSVSSADFLHDRSCGGKPEAAGA